MLKIEHYLHSFSFRTGVMIFLSISALLIMQRILIYEHGLSTAYDDIQTAIDTREQEMDDVVDSHGIAYLEKLLATMSDNTRDKRLYMLLNHRGILTGNLKRWPDLRFATRGYEEIFLPPPDEESSPLHLLVSVSEYPGGDSLMIGYDLERVDRLKQEFSSLIIETLILSLGVSLMISAFIVWLLARHLRQFNLACSHVMQGDLRYRIFTRSSSDEFGKLAHNINRMLSWIHSLLHTFKESSNAIAHDMRTPLSRLRLELRALSENPQLDEDLRVEVCGYVERLDEIITIFESILNIARAESRSSMELFGTVDLKQLLHDVVEFYFPIIEEKKLNLSCTLPETKALMKGDKQLLGQAVVNLIDNACKYTPEGGRLEVRLIAPILSDSLMISVADSGSGIPEAYREKVKERFFRLDESRSTTGHGLGLSLVAAVAELHQGTLRLEDNAPGLKATLTLRKMPE